MNRRLRLLPVSAVLAGAVALGGCSLWADDPQPMPVMMVTPVVMQPVLMGQGIYMVRSSGSLMAIAKRTGANLGDLVALNPGVPVNQSLPAGSQVWLPFPWAP